MYHCDKCMYSTKDKSNYNRHLHIHDKVNTSNLKHCNLCSYQTFLNCNLQRYLKSHTSRTIQKRYYPKIQDALKNSTDTSLFYIELKKSNGEKMYLVDSELWRNYTMSKKE